MHVRLQGEQQIGEQPLVHWRPLEFWDAEHGRARAGAELAPLLLRHRHTPETQIDAQVPLQLGCGATVEGLRLVEETWQSQSNHRVKPRATKLSQSGCAIAF